MLRAALLGLLVVSASACSKSATETSAKVVPGAVAGKVLEVKGSVTVKHGDATKPLAAGETVEGDDTVITGADGNVVIELAHNSARWELGPNKQQRVRESIAWKAEKATAQEVEQATAAAGRPAERNAAGTVATADEPAEAEEDEAPAPEAAMAPPSKAAEAEPDMMPKGGGSAPVERPRRRVASAPKSPPPPPPADVSDDEGKITARTTRGPIAKAPLETARVESAAAPGGGGSVAVGGGTRSGTRGGGAPPNAGALLTAKSTALHKCVVDHGAKEDVTVVVDIVNGKPTVKLTSKAAISAALDKCLKGVVNGIGFSGSAKVTRVVKP